MKNIGVFVTIGIFLIGALVGFGKLQADTITTEKRVAKVEDKVEALKETTDKTTVSQDIMTKQLDTMSNKMDKITDLLIEIKRGS